MPNPDFHLRTLGEFSLRRTAPPQDIVLRVSKPLVIVVLLAMAPKLSARREHLAALLWPESDPQRARRSLRQALFYLSKNTDRQLVIAENRQGMVELNPSRLSVDAWEFERALREARYADAIALYRGEFLSRVNRRLGEEIEHVIEAERSRLRTGLEVAYTRLIARGLEAGETETAIAYAREHAAANPTSERAQTVLIRALSAGGYELEALGTYRTSRTLFHAGQTGRSAPYGIRRGGATDALREKHRHPAEPIERSHGGAPAASSVESYPGDGSRAENDWHGFRLRLQRAIGRVAGLCGLA